MKLAELEILLNTDFSINEDQAALRYTDDYALITAEIQKLSSFTGGKPNYVTLIEAASKLLQQGSNDLLILNYLNYALMEQYQWQGFIMGSKLLLQRLKFNWDGLYPIKHKTRTGAMDWLLERYQKFLQHYPLQGLSESLLQSLLNLIVELSALSNECFNNEINLAFLQRAIAAQLQRLEEEQKNRALQSERDRESERLQQVQHLQETLTQHEMPISSEEYLMQLATADLHQFAAKRIFTDQMHLLRQNPLLFAIYKHHRAELWWEYPLSFQEVLVRMDAQPFNWEAYHQALQLKMQEEYLEALIAFEIFFQEQPYFLEVQMHIYECLEALGAESHLLTMLSNECRELCQHYPDLLQAKLSNRVAVISKNSAGRLSLNTN